MSLDIFDILFVTYALSKILIIWSMIPFIKASWRGEYSPYMQIYGFTGSYSSSMSFSCSVNILNYVFVLVFPLMIEVSINRIYNFQMQDLFISCNYLFLFQLINKVMEVVSLKTSAY